jgi:hypothetical protein
MPGQQRFPTGPLASLLLSGNHSVAEVLGLFRMPVVAATDQLSSLSRTTSSPSSSHNPCAFGTPLAPCQGMPRLTSYQLIARLLLLCIPAQSLRHWHSPGPVRGDATTDKLPTDRALDSPLHSRTILAPLARPWPRARGCLD